MGTRGLFAYKWRGRYYVYYNHYDSYKEGLGRSLSSEVPSDPEEYKTWLDRTRSQYQQLEEKLDRDYLTVTIQKILDNEMTVFADEKLDGMEMTPLFVAPGNDLFIEYVYVFDLDQERFSCNNCGYFKLDKLTQDWIKINGEVLFFGDELDEGETVDGSITTPASQRVPFSSDPEPLYAKLNAETTSPKPFKGTSEKLTRKPGFITSSKFFDVFLQEHKASICEARDQCGESDFLFREISFALLCLASCSSELVRYVSTTKLVTKKKWDYAVLTTPDSESSQEFVSKLAHSYHLEGKPAGSCPQSESFWMLNVLICLKRDVDIISTAGFKDAIVSAVEKGRSDGKEFFDAIIFSIKHFILVRVTNSKVVHTKCISFVRELNMKFGRYGKQSDGRPLGNVIAVPQPEDETLVEHTVSTKHAFALLTLMFEGAQLQQLPPSTAHQHGILPNEVYANIIRYVVGPTRAACLVVSRAFRDFASEVVHVDDHLRFEYKDGLICVNPANGSPFGTFSPVYNDPNDYFPSRRGVKVGMSYVAVIGYPDGSAFFEPDVEICFAEEAADDED